MLLSSKNTAVPNMHGARLISLPHWFLVAGLTVDGLCTKNSKCPTLTKQIPPHYRFYLQKPCSRGLCT
jgi:hypothetical protein